MPLRRIEGYSGGVLFLSVADGRSVTLRGLLLWSFLLMSWFGENQLMQG
jgi:hypothetical protein